VRVRVRVRVRVTLDPDHQTPNSKLQTPNWLLAPWATKLRGLWAFRFVHCDRDRGRLILGLVCIFLPTPAFALNPNTHTHTHTHTHTRTHARTHKGTHTHTHKNSNMNTKKQQTEPKGHIPGSLSLFLVFVLCVVCTLCILHVYMAVVVAGTKQNTRHRRKFKSKSKPAHGDWNWKPGAALAAPWWSVVTAEAPSAVAAGPWYL
jgi:hypothetical protein